MLKRKVFGVVFEITIDRKSKYFIVRVGPNGNKVRSPYNVQETLKQMEGLVYLIKRNAEWECTWPVIHHDGNYNKSCAWTIDKDDKPYMDRRIKKIISEASRNGMIIIEEDYIRRDEGR